LEGRVTHRASRRKGATHMSHADAMDERVVAWDAFEPLDKGTLGAAAPLGKGFAQVPARKSQDDVDLSSMMNTWGGTSALGSTGFPRLAASTSPRTREAVAKARDAPVPQRQPAIVAARRPASVRHVEADRVPRADDSADVTHLSADSFDDVHRGDAPSADDGGLVGSHESSRNGEAPRAVRGQDPPQRSYIDVRDLVHAQREHHRPSARARSSHRHHRGKALAAAADSGGATHDSMPRRRRRATSARHHAAAERAHDVHHAASERAHEEHRAVVPHMRALDATASVADDNVRATRSAVSTLDGDVISDEEAERKRRTVIAIVICVSILVVLSAIGIYALLRHVGDGNVAVGWHRLIDPLRTGAQRWARNVRDAFHAHVPSDATDVGAALAAAPAAPQRTGTVLSPTPVRAWSPLVVRDGTMDQGAANAHYDVDDIDDDDDDYDYYGRYEPAYHHDAPVPDHGHAAVRFGGAEERGYADAAHDGRPVHGGASWDVASRAPSYAGVDGHGYGAHESDDEAAYGDDEPGTPLMSGAARRAPVAPIGGDPDETAVSDTIGRPPGGGNYSRSELRAAVDVDTRFPGGAAQIYAGSGAHSVAPGSFGASAREMEASTASGAATAPPARPTGFEPSSAEAPPNASILDMVRNHKALEEERYAAEAAAAAEMAERRAAERTAHARTVAAGGGDRVYTASAEQFERAAHDEQRAREDDVREKQAMRRDIKRSVSNIYDNKARQLSGAAAAALAPTAGDTTDYVNVHTQEFLRHHGNGE